MNNDIFNILKCPITSDSLRLLTKKEIDKVNLQISKDSLIHFDGSVVKGGIKSGFISLNNKYVFPIVDGIIILNRDLATVTDKKYVNKYKANLSAEKQSVINFYNEIGWKKGSSKQFEDALKYEDLRKVAHEYIHKCHLRVNNYINHKGRYLLDAGSGPIQYREYLSYSKGYDKRVCVDISFLALKEAKKRLGNKGIYILADLTNLPFKDNSFDGAVSLHVIYHIPKNEQKTALKEIYRVLKPSSSAAVVYSWPAKFNLLLIIGKIARKIGILKKKVNKPDFYFQPQNRAYISKGLGFNLEIYSWRSISVESMRKYIHDKLFGRKILSLIYWWENEFPVLAGWVGRYPLLIIKK